MPAHGSECWFARMLHRLREKIIVGDRVHGEAIKNDIEISSLHFKKF